MTDYDVRVEGLTKRFDDIIAVDDVSFAVERGRFLTLLGPSGCGKTTLLRCIDGLEIPTAGEVYIRDERVTDQPPYERDTSMVFQSYALFPHMTVGENVAFGLQMRGIPNTEAVVSDEAARNPTSTADSNGGIADSFRRLLRRKGSDEIEARVADALELVELGGFQDRNPEELSGGQRQRVALARALVTEPTVLLLDEPLGALDLKLRRNMQVELKKIQREVGITFVYVTHDQEEALTMSDEIAVMNNGRIEQIGDATAIYESPATEFVADFIGESNIIWGSYHEGDDGATIENGGLRYHVLPTDGAEGEVAFAVRPEKIRLGPEAEGFANSFTAEVIEEIYKGNLGKYVVRLENGQELTIDMQIKDQGQLLSTGRDVTVGWSADNAVVLTE